MSFTTINDKLTAALRNRAEWYAHDGKQGRRQARQRPAYEEPTEGDTLNTNILESRETEHDRIPDVQRQK